MPYCTKNGRWCFGALFRFRDRFVLNDTVRLCSLACAEHFATSRGYIVYAESCVSESGRTHHAIRSMPEKEHQRNSETYRPDKPDKNGRPP